MWRKAAVQDPMRDVLADTIVSQPRASSKAGISGESQSPTGEQWAANQRVFHLLQPSTPWALHMIPWHELLGVRVEVDLLVDRIAVVANPTYRTGLKRQDPFTVRYQLPAASHIR